MHTAWAAGLVLLLVSGCTPALLPSVSTPTSSSGADRREVTVVRVLDGDTFDATDDGSALRVRILGIDTPEISHDSSTSDCGADAATATLKHLIGNQLVIIEHDPRSAARDQYGRELAYVTSDGIDVGLRLIEEGLAEAWYPTSVTAPSRDEAYRAATTRAQTAKAGAWKTCSTLGRQA